MRKMQRVFHDTIVLLMWNKESLCLNENNDIIFNSSEFHATMKIEIPRPNDIL